MVLKGLVKKRWTRKTGEHSSADIIKRFYELPDPFSLHQFTFKSFLCLWKKVYSRRGGGGGWLDLKTPPCDAGTQSKELKKCRWQFLKHPHKNTLPSVSQPLAHSVSRVCMQTRKHRMLPTLVPMVGVPMFSWLDPCQGSSNPFS